MYKLKSNKSDQKSRSEYSFVNYIFDKFLISGHNSFDFVGSEETDQTCGSTF